MNITIERSRALSVRNYEQRAVISDSSIIRLRPHRCASGALVAVVMDIRRVLEVSTAELQTLIHNKLLCLCSSPRSNWHGMWYTK